MISPAFFISKEYRPDERKRVCLVSDFEVVQRVTAQVTDFIREVHQVSDEEAASARGERAIFLTKPLFLSAIDGSKNGSSNYSHLHVDRDTKQHFAYSALLYLDDGSGQDFVGGDLVFAARQRPLAVSPRVGKLGGFVKLLYKIPKCGGSTFSTLALIDWPIVV